MSSHACYLRNAQSLEPPVKRAKSTHCDTGDERNVRVDRVASNSAPVRRSVDGYGPAREGEQVAALTEDEDGSVQWILAVVHKYYAAEVRCICCQSVALSSSCLN